VIESRYPLTGIRSATTRPQWALVERAVEVLRHDPRVLAAWLVGSLASDDADPFSDIDLHVCVADEAIEELRHGGWKHLVNGITPMVMATDFTPGGIGGYCVTPDWVHLDFAPVPRSRFDAAKLTGMLPLFDRTGELLPTEPVPPSSSEGAPYFPAGVVDWFFYMFGNLAVVVGRNEPVLGTNAVITIQDTCVVPLFMAERGIHRGGGNKRQRPFLSDEQYHILASLPPLAPTIDSVIDSELALAQIFIPRGRRLAAWTAARWPDAFESATVARLEHALGIPIQIN
jgi:hypothetical protein